MSHFAFQREIRLAPGYIDLTECQQNCIAGRLSWDIDTDLSSWVSQSPCSTKTKTCICASEKEAEAEAFIGNCQKNFSLACARSTVEQSGAVQWVVGYCGWNIVTTSTLSVSSTIATSPASQTSSSIKQPASPSLSTISSSTTDNTTSTIVIPPPTSPPSSARSTTDNPASIIVTTPIPVSPANPPSSAGSSSTTGNPAPTTNSTNTTTIETIHFTIWGPIIVVIFYGVFIVIIIKKFGAERRSVVPSDVPTASDIPTASGGPTARSTSKTPHPVGSEVLFQGVDPITADIVFVHGLRGHRRDTWTKDNICWPQELLSKEEPLSHIRVLTLGYDANIVDPNGRASLNTLFQHSINLVQELSRVRRKDARDRPIIFVAHSLGGLIVKDALDYSNRVQDTHPHLARILSSTRGIIFLGTPHRGSGMTSIMKVVASVAQMALRNASPDLIRDLERDSQTLDRIGDSFGRILDKRTFAVWSFAEELAMTGIGKVVPMESAIIGDPRENRETIYGDHISMVKFSTRDDPGYMKVLNSIEMLLEGLGEDSLTRSK